MVHHAGGGATYGWEPDHAVRQLTSRTRGTSEPATSPGRFTGRESLVQDPLLGCDQEDFASLRECSRIEIAVTSPLIFVTSPVDSSIRSKVVPDRSIM